MNQFVYIYVETPDEKRAVPY